MADLTIYRGQTFEHNLEWYSDTAKTVALDITNSVTRVWIRLRHGSPIVLQLSSYDSDEIERTDASNGQETIKIPAPVQRRVFPDSRCHAWDAKLTRRKSPTPRTSVGTVAVTAGSGIITGTSLVLTDVEPGDLIDITDGTNTENNLQVVILAVGGEGTADDPGAGNLLTDYTGWVTTSGLSHDIYIGQEDVPTDFRGNVLITGEITT